VLPVTVFRRGKSTIPIPLFGCFDPKVVAMLAEIFMVRLEAEARLVEEVLPSSTSRFIPFSPKSQFGFKEAERKVVEAPSEEPLVRLIR
jgi:hypothetical protein